MIDIPIRRQRVEIPFAPFMKNLEEACGWDHRDMDGKYKWQRETRERLCAEHNIDYSVWGKIPYAEMDESQKAFHDIYRVEMAKAPAYQDTWHWFVDHAFSDVRNGCSEYLSSELIEDDIIEDLEIPDYVVTVLRAIFDAVPEDHPARDGGGINFYISW